MMTTIFGLFEKVFTNCAIWTDELLEAVGGKPIVIAGFILVLVVSLLFIPLRGGSLLLSPDSFHDFTQKAMYKPKHSSGKRKVFGGNNGKFSERHYKFNGKRK